MFKNIKYNLNLSFFFKLNIDAVGFACINTYIKGFRELYKHIITVPLKHQSSFYLFFDVTLGSGEIFFSRLGPDALR